MQCPYCTKTMESGYIYTNLFDRATFWLPEGINPEIVFNAFISRKKLNDHGGFVIGEASKHRLILKKHPRSYCCKECEILITDLKSAENGVDE